VSPWLIVTKGWIFGTHVPIVALAASSPVVITLGLLATRFRRSRTGQEGRSPASSSCSYVNDSEFTQ
jgi:hypothetical protein